MILGASIDGFLDEVVHSCRLVRFNADARAGLVLHRAASRACSAARSVDARFVEQARLDLQSDNITLDAVSPAKAMRTLQSAIIQD